MKSKVALLGTVIGALLTSNHKSLMLLLFVLCGVFIGCKDDSIYEGEGPYKVILAGDSCLNTGPQILVNVNHKGLYAQVLRFPIDFRADSGIYIIDVACDTGAISGGYQYVWRDTVEIKSDTTFQIPCQPCK